MTVVAALGDAQPTRVLVIEVDGVVSERNTAV